MTPTLTQSVSISPEWQRTPAKITHQTEYMMCCGLNKYLSNEGLKVDRVSNDKYSPYDLKVFEFDYDTLEEGGIVCRIDVERKPVRFPRNGYPETWKRGVSFAFRKLLKPVNDQRDVYLLVDNNRVDPRIIWVPYGIIKEFGVYENFRGYKNEFKVIKDNNADKLNYTFKTLAAWCTRLKNQDITRAV
jgi:hypothetical protein